MGLSVVVSLTVFKKMIALRQRIHFLKVPLRMAMLVKVVSTVSLQMPRRRRENMCVRKQDISIISGDACSGHWCVIQCRYIF
jgi:hypothetical protein